MSLLATIRQRQAPWARSVLGLFVVVWLNMALQPCAMAFGGSNNHGRTHCPAAQTEGIYSQSTNEADESDSGMLPCKTSAAQCAFVDDFNYDGRLVKVKVKDQPSDVPVAIASPIPLTAPEGDWSAPVYVGDSSIVPGNPPPLNVSYCVYLI